MAGKERRRVVFNDISASGVGQNTVIITILEASVNVHDVSASLAVTPTSADANCDGIWALVVLPRGSTAVPTITTANLNLELENPTIWGIGVFQASNQTPWNMPRFAPRTSRNLPKGARVVLILAVEGLTAGTAQVNFGLTFHERTI